MQENRIIQLHDPIDAVSCNKNQDKIVCAGSRGGTGAFWENMTGLFSVEGVPSDGPMSDPAARFEEGGREEQEPDAIALLAEQCGLEQAEGRPDSHHLDHWSCRPLEC